MKAPETAEFEITVFGRGVGECIVVHVDGEWIIVDTFNDPDAGMAVAEWYLDALLVEPNAVKAIVVTHFDADHYRAIDKLHDRYQEARLMVTEALQADTFVALYDEDEDEEPIFDVLPATLARARSRRLGDAGLPGLRQLKIGAAVHSTTNSSITAISPSELATEASCESLTEAVKTGDRHIVASQLRDDNRCSVALHVALPGFSAVLGADLVNDTAGIGWEAVLSDSVIGQLAKSDYYKVPHHGSVTAEHPGVWERLIGPVVTLSVTPFWPSAIPALDDLRRLLSHGRVWRAAPSSSSVEDEFDNVITIEPATGFVRARRFAGESEWRVDTGGVAEEFVDIQ